MAVSVGGRFFVRVPEDLDECDDGWDAWFDDALTAASIDGRWDDCTEIEDVQVGVLDERGRVVVPPRSA